MGDVRERDGACPQDMYEAACGELRAEEKDRLAEPSISFDFGEGEQDENDRRDQ